MEFVYLEIRLLELASSLIMAGSLLALAVHEIRRDGRK